MRVDDFDFDLPERLIALRPAKPRRAARLLVADAENEHVSTFERLAEELRPGDLIVFNDTKVIPARLAGRRVRGDSDIKMEATLAQRLDGETWRALAKPGKKLAPGDRLVFGDLTGVLAEKGEGGLVDIRFDVSGPALDEAVARVGVPPLPPYIAARRAADEADEKDYQTIFAEKAGAVAAPTASLHFDEAVMASLEEKGVKMARLTLHVGAGTFLPVKVEDARSHKMHAEWGEIGAATAEQIAETKASGGRVIAAGTTALRLLETAARETGAVRPWIGETDIFITPGFEFRAADGLITNFHLPRSTLFMLVSAFLGRERMQALYAHAIAEEMRFYSYGDGSLLWRR